MRRPADLLTAMRRGWPLLAPLIPLLIWRSAPGGLLYGWTSQVLVSKAVIVASVLKGLWQPFDLAMTAILFAAIAIGWARRRLDPGLAIAAILLALAAMAMPTTVLSSWGADMRLAPLAPMLALLAIRPAERPSIERAVLALGFALFAARIAVAAWLWFPASAQYERRLALLDRVPGGGRLGFVIVVPCHEPWRLTPDRKLAGLAVVRRGMFTNTLFQVPGTDLIRLRNATDRAHWTDGSQDVNGCHPHPSALRASPLSRRERGGAPQARKGEGDLITQALTTKLAAMRTDEFDYVWIAGIDPATPVPNTLVARSPSDAIVRLR